MSDVAQIKRGIELGQVTNLVECNVCKKHTEISTKYYSQRDMNKCKYCQSEINIDTKFSISSRNKTEEYNIACLSGKEINRYIVNDYYYIKSGLYGIDYKEIIYSEQNLFVKRISTKPEVTLINEYASSFNTIYSIYDLKSVSKKEILLILNSKLIAFYYEYVFNLGMNLTTQITVEYLKQIPIKTSENQQSFIQKADEMLTLNKEFQEKSNKFKKYFSGQLGLEKLSKKLENWHELTFADFIKEFNKAIKKANKEKEKEGLPAVAVLTKKDEIEWMDVFEDYKKEVQTLQTQINQTDNQIDLMVYKLYELTHEEVLIVDPEFSMSERDYNEFKINNAHAIS